MLGAWGDFGVALRGYLKAPLWCLCKEVGV